MAFRYANQSDVMHELEIDTSDPENDAVIAQIERIEAGLASAFDHRVGREWGAVPVPSTRTIANGCTRGVMVFAKPARSIVSVSHGGSFDGSGWADETVETTWHERFNADGLIYGLERESGLWPSRVRVEAIWASDTDLAVPEDVSYALTWLTIRQYRKMTASPMEMVGPDGMTVPTPDAWSDPTVKALIDKYRVVEVIV